MFSTFLTNWIYGQAPLFATLKQHRGPVLALAISPDEKIIASGGSEGIAVWDLESKKKVPTAQLSFYERCQVSSLCWIGVPDDAVHTLVYGNAMGYLVFLQRRDDEDKFKVVYSTRVARGEEILDITTGSHGGLDRIAIGTRDKCVQIMDFDAINCTLTPIHSKAYDNDKDIVPKTLAFDTNQNLLVFGLYDRGLYRYSGEDAKSISQHRLQSQIGNAAVDLNKRLCVVDNVGSGFDLYQLDTAEFIRTFPTGEARETYPKGVAFSDHSRAVVGGSDHGIVYIFNRKTGRPIERLKYDRKGGVETIAVHDCRDGSILIAAASASKSNGPNSVRVWRWAPTRKPKKQDGKSSSTAMQTTFFILWLILLIIVGGYVHEFVHIESVRVQSSDKEEGSFAGITVTLQAPSWSMLVRRRAEGIQG